MSELTGRERIALALSHREADRLAACDGFWTALLEQWYEEGLPRDVALDQYFGYDILTIRPDTSLRLPTTILEKTPEYTLVRDSNGATVKSARDGTFPSGAIEHLVKTREDWEEVKLRLCWDSGRVDWEAARSAYAEGRARGQYIVYGGAISWDAALPLLGTQAQLYAMVDDPAWLHDMFQTLTDICLAGAEEMMAAGFEFDGAFLCDDMGFRSGPLFSLRTYDALFFDQDRQVCDFFKARGLPVILHSCGNVKKLIPRLIEAGYACLNPLEVKAGMDLVGLKGQYGEVLAFMGGIDVRKVNDPDPGAIEREIATKLPVAMRGGGYIYALDGPVTLGTSLAQYRRALELVRLYGQYNSRGGRGGSLPPA